jgi:hypothetical protein
MNTFDIGHFVGMLLAALVGPLILLIVFKLIPAMRRRPGASNGITGVLAVLIAFVPVNTPLVEKVVAAALLAALFYWQYTRDLRALARASAAEAAPKPSA